MGKDVKRRELFKKTGLVGLGLMAGSVAEAQNQCRLTPRQTEGPCYPARRRNDEDNDLTIVRGQTGTPQGEIIVLRGNVKDSSCVAIGGAIVEIWQASDSGRYDHPLDDNPAELDPHFQYWGRHTTAADGSFWFKTIKPGLYPGRTRHIHMRVIADGHRTLTTQIYFTGEPRNRSDGIYRSLTPAQRALVTVDLERGEGELHPSGSVDIILGSTPRL